MPLSLTAGEAVAAAASLLRPVREQPAGSNRGQMVEAILIDAGATPGDPWCAADVSYIGKSMLGARWPLPITASCDVLLEAARKKGVLLTKGPPRRGMVFLIMKNPNDAVHTGIVRTVFIGGTWDTWEGNTSDPKRPSTREGWGHFNRPRGGSEDHTTYYYIDWESLL